MKELLILGKAPIKYKIRELKTSENEIWMLGTDPREGGDVYFELHGIKTNHPNTVYELPEVVYKQGLPINNSISALLIHAYLLGYKDINILGCPMDSRAEYITQKPALAYVVGYLNGKELNINWSHCPSNINYGKHR